MPYAGLGESVAHNKKSDPLPASDITDKAENGDQCFCGYGLSLSQLASESQCRSPCSGAPAEVCGGFEYMTLLQYYPRFAQACPVSMTGTEMPRQPHDIPVMPGAPVSASHGSDEGFISTTISPGSSTNPLLTPLPASSPGTSVLVSGSSLPNGVAQYPSPVSEPALIDVLASVTTWSKSASTSSSVATDAENRKYRTIFRPGPHTTTQPRLKDQSDVIVFGSVSAADRGDGLYV